MIKMVMITRVPVLVYTNHDPLVQGRREVGASRKCMLLVVGGQHPILAKEVVEEEVVAVGRPFSSILLTCLFIIKFLA
jgi:hypothetical protein